MKCPAKEKVLPRRLNELSAMAPGPAFEMLRVEEQPGEDTPKLSEKLLHWVLSLLTVKPMARAWLVRPVHTPG